ncbi:MAG: Hsp20/alpha crystallin family protein [Acetobacteraceae bacterium]|nr:Hsp20/alpha crystallin family protein [Acetobacteraceae bacterium]
MATTPVEVKRSTSAPPAPSDAWRSLRSEMDKLFDRFAGGLGMPSLERMFDMAPAAFIPMTVSRPAMDLTEDVSGYMLSAELPGVAESDIEVTVSGDLLTVKGEKKQETERKDADWHLSERSYGMVQRSLYLPEGVDRPNITAAFANGVLTVKLPKTAMAAADKPQKIEVKAAA